MKWGRPVRLGGLALLAALLVAPPMAEAAVPSPGAKGCVIYKSGSFDTDQKARLAEYTGFDDFRTGTTVKTLSGEVLRLTPGHRPLFIPYPSDGRADPGVAARRIAEAKGRFPHLGMDLAAIEQAWQPSGGEARGGQQASAAGSSGSTASPLKLASGQTLQNWVISRVSGDKVTISHSAGVATVPIATLPREVVAADPRLSQSRSALPATAAGALPAPESPQRPEASGGLSGAETARSPAPPERSVTSPQRQRGEIRLTNGTVLRNWRILKVVGDRVSIVHDDGVSVVPMRQIPKDVRATEGQLAMSIPKGAIENSLGMRFVPAGSPGVLFSVWETRVSDFAAFAEATKRDSGSADFNWRNPGFVQEPDHPVVAVEWQDAADFCRWLTEEERRKGVLDENKEYRLPTDREWSRAAGDAKYPWGDSFPPPDGAANLLEINDLRELRTRAEEGRRRVKEWVTEPVDPNVPAIDSFRKAKESIVLADWGEWKNDGVAFTAPVGSFSENRYGLHDLGGNASEMCEDPYRSSMSRDSRAVDLGLPGAHVARGGHWRMGTPFFMESAERHPDSGLAANFRGFRCVLADVARTASLSWPLARALGGLGSDWGLTEPVASEPLGRWVRRLARDLEQETGMAPLRLVRVSNPPKPFDGGVLILGLEWYDVLSKPTETEISQFYWFRGIGDCSRESLTKLIATIAAESADEGRAMAERDACVRTLQGCLFPYDVSAESRDGQPAATGGAPLRFRFKEDDPENAERRGRAGVLAIVGAHGFVLSRDFPRYVKVREE